jgi:cell division septation protein DedD
MNEIFRRRLIGLAVLLVLVFILSLLLPNGAGQQGDGLPTTTVALDGSARPRESGAIGELEPRQAPLSDDSLAPSSSQDVQPVATPLPQPKTDTPQTIPPVAKPLLPPSAKTSESKVPSAIATKPVTAPPSPLPKSIPVPAKPTAVITKPVESATASPKSANGPLWYVQIGSFADAGNAQTTLSLLQNIGYHGETSKIVNAAKTTLYRVRLGPFPTKAAAQQVYGKVTRQGYPHARVLLEPGKT